MPIFEFKCKECGEKFEKLVFSSEKEEIKCPKCKSSEVVKLLSVFSSKGSACSVSGAGFS